ncbi:unnamed protein product, partial [marine sediment metagenome]
SIQLAVEVDQIMNDHIRTAAGEERHNILGKDSCIDFQLAQHFG